MKKYGHPLTHHKYRCTIPLVSATFKNTLYICLVFVFLSSCVKNKVIELNLEGTEKKYVIEAVITDQPGTARVIISQTTDFNEDNLIPGISGALVSVTEAGGATTTFTETSPGVYEASTLAGTSGKSYSLAVTIGTLHYQAASSMPEKINLDTIFTTRERLDTAVQNIVNTQYTDPAGRGNYYRFIQYVNGIKEASVFVTNDDYSDGLKNNTPLFYSLKEDNSNAIKSGDTVRVDMLCIDKAIYKYWFSLSQSSTGVSNQATPANPLTNIKGGALGYFSAHTLQSKKMVVQ